MNKPQSRNITADIPYDHGMPLVSALERREALADKYDREFGKERVFPELVEALLEEVPEGSSVLEVGAATGVLTRPLLGRAGRLTAQEPSPGMLSRLLASEVASSPRLRIRQGMAEDLGDEETFEVAVVTFTPRRGFGLMRLLLILATHVSESVIMLLDDDPGMNWAYVSRGASKHGFDVRVRFVNGSCSEDEQPRRAVIMVAELGGCALALEPEEAWTLSAREVRVPHPIPRGAATRLVRYLLAGGDRALIITADEEGLDRLHGNLRTAAHRLGREEITVRRHGGHIQLVRLPRDMVEDDETAPVE
ncbi:MAG: hypothetical protein OEV43_03390 [Coriobacteriia bacterium]|nr:hypothetical protein [Coriobacteriia bacterium]